MTTPIVVSPSQRAILYLDQVGWIEAQVSRAFDGGFAVVIESTVYKKDKLAAKLTWLANRHELELVEDRRHERIHPETTAAPTIVLPDGRSYQAVLVDVSLLGAAIVLPVGACAHHKSGAPTDQIAERPFGVVDQLRFKAPMLRCN